MPAPPSVRNSTWNLTRTLHEKELAAKADGPLDPDNQVKAPWSAFLGVVFMFYSLGQWCESDMALAFYRSRVVCETPLPDLTVLKAAGGVTTVPGICPGGSYFDGGECKAVGRWHRDWSASESCPVKTIVVGRAVKIIGRLTTMSTIGAMIASIFMGATLIDSWGRKPMMLLSFATQFLMGLSYCAVCFLDLPLDTPATLGWLATGSVISASMNTFSSAAGAMSVDGTVPDTTERNNRIVGLNVMRMLGSMASVAASIFILSLKLTSYDQVWSAYCVALLIQVGISAMLLMETTPVEKKEVPMNWAETFKHAANEIFATFEICTADLKISAGIAAVGVSSGIFTAAMSMSPSWTFLVLGLTQSQGAGAGLVGSLFNIIGTACSAPVMAMTSPVKTLVFAQTTSTIGLICVASGYWFPNHAQALFWVGTGGLSSFAGGLCNPAAFSVLSGRVAPENQGKFFSGIGLAAMGFVAACTYIYTNLILRSEGEALKKEMAFAWILAAFTSMANTLSVCAVFGWSYGMTPVREVTFRLGMSGTRLLVDPVDSAPEG